MPVGTTGADGHRLSIAPVAASARPSGQAVFRAEAVASLDTPGAPQVMPNGVACRAAGAASSRPSGL
eukprot:12164768-Alexandrium_andersonii.AAC.1